jgi:hypothetical protein
MQKPLPGVSAMPPGQTVSAAESLPGNEGGPASGGAVQPDRRKQVFDFAADSTKQLITVSAGVITATVIFSKDLDTISRYLALASWILLLVSVICGLLALLSMTGNLQNSLVGSVEPNLSEDIHSLSKYQLGSFLLGMFMVMVFGFFAARVKSPPETKPATVNCIVPNLPAPVIVQVPAAPNPLGSGPKKGTVEKGRRKKH